MWIRIRLALRLYRYGWIRSFLGTDPYLLGYTARANLLGSVLVSAFCKRWERICDNDGNDDLRFI